VVTVGAVLLLSTRRPDALRWALPIGILVFGLALVTLLRRDERNGSRRLIGFAAVAVGIGGIIIAIVRANSGT
jgi:hypothetical protein